MNKKFWYIFVALALISLGMSPYTPNGSSNQTPANYAGKTAALSYYVDNSNPTCSDTLNNGQSAGAPFCTIGKAAGLAVAGDTVHVMAGTYLETVRPGHNGISGSPITFLADPDVTVKGDGTTSGNAFRLSASSYITINGFNIADTVEDGIFVSGSNHIIITNNTITSAGTPANGLDRDGIYFGGVTDSTISGNTTSENSSHGIAVQSASNNVTISNNTSFGNATVVSRYANGIIIQGASTNITVIHNIVYNNEDSGIGFTGNSDNALVIGNLSYGNSDHGIDDNSSKNITIVGNTVQGNATVGINLEGNDAANYSSGVIQNNLVASNGINPPAGHSPGNIRVDSVSMTHTTLNYNLVYESAGLVEYIWGSSQYTLLSEFHAATGQESAGLQADPLFVAAAAPVTQPVTGGGHPTIATGDYHLTSASPAIDSANSGATGEPLLDIEGQPRLDYAGVSNTGIGPRAYDDRGAYEYQLPVPQVIQFDTTAPADAVVGGDTYTPTATGGASGNPVIITLDVTSTGCSLSAGIVSFIGVGTCVIDANQDGNTYYSPALQVQQIIPVGKGIQTVVFTTTAPSDAVVGGPTYAPAATGGASGNPVIITIDASASGVCSISGLGVVSFTAVGTCKINADQPGNDNYNAGTAQQSFAVGKGNQVVAFSSTAPTDAVVDGPTYTPIATGGGSPNPVIITLDATSAGCSLGAGVVSFTAVGSCVIDANQAGDDNYNPAPQAQQIIPVGKIPQAIQFDTTAPSDAMVDGPTYTPAATGGASGNPVIFSLDDTSSGCVLSAGVVSFTAVGTCKINADQFGNSHYYPAPQVQQSFAVGKGSQVIVFSSTAPAHAEVGGPTYTPAATGGPSGNPVTFTIDASASGVCSISVTGVVSFTGAGTCVINADQLGNANYNDAQQEHQSFLVVLVYRVFLPLLNR